MAEKQTPQGDGEDSQAAQEQDYYAEYTRKMLAAAAEHRAALAGERGPEAQADAERLQEIVDYAGRLFGPADGELPNDQPGQAPPQHDQPPP